MSTTTEPGTQPVLLLVCSSGGHLAQLLALRPWYETWRRCWVTFDTPEARSLLAGEEVVPAYHPTTRDLRNLLRNAVLAARLLRRRRVAAVVTTGAGVAVPFVVLARLRRIPTIYIEVYDRIDTPTLTARLCRPFLSAMLVQWEEQRRQYPEATVVGTLL
ncbi:Oligosaccharide biosynthesis protein Alg14 like [Micromonospora phaseoli]|uniref:Oligosaccharide biosynthesis protein Alg14 like n=1 Tax=Micromonospora phaseoli TaxID=1144548 RepID=A0A1H6STM6_9ACTN|nr:UDP-N-acetylglucosamine--LPS N-acetylglucosamine transferase [Micromonospora phaseoli]PZW04102.1 oligosaccharide biosynthesis protein Alg14 [Micromonospora phaseoli]SEI71328.1 Oligosaccharide biosynthesis protein Alg14 like [Micromonospora phaseoli]